MGTFGPDDGMPHSIIISGTFGLKTIYDTPNLRI